ncbi:hypothetical protein AB0F20_05700 [Streptomyces goshikiensis]|uniref:hypothetical protein n=1 Tax=Streptomyces goshikiensis TaxID=1942 RepID=UPI0033D0D110
MSSDWYEQRRKDEDARAERERISRAAAVELEREQKLKDRADRRAADLQDRKDRAQRRRERTAKRQRDLAPGSVYRRGTIGLVGFSIAASLPAQIIHFVSIHWMLFPIGPALEGAAWILAAGVAFADEKKLAAWVRWVLRALSMSAASYAALINYQYGQGLVSHGLTASQAQTAAMGLAAVTLGGPLFFEVRQWVLTLSAAVGNARHKIEQKARARHDRKRRRAFPKVMDRARELMLAAPYGSLKEEDAFGRAWWDIHGAPRAVTADVIKNRLKAESTVAEVLDEAERTPERLAVEFLLADLFGTEVGVADTAAKGGRGGGQEGRTALGRLDKQSPEAPRYKDAVEPLAEADIEKARDLLTLVGPDKFSAPEVAKLLGRSNVYARRIRNAVTEQKEG